MTQNKRIAQFLKNGNHITKPIALRKFGSWRLAARIHDLRETMVIGTYQNMQGNIFYQYLGMKKRQKKRSR